MNLRTSKAITLPKSWLDWHEQELGCPVTDVCIETDGKKLIVYPYVQKKPKELRKK